MITVGLLTEYSYDTISIKALLEKKYAGRVVFKPILPHQHGHNLDAQKTRKTILGELKFAKCDFVVFVRDLDGLPSQEDLVGQKQRWFTELNKICGNSHLLLLNIWELEAMIFADIDVFNAKFKTTLKGNRNPMYISDPKGELMSATYKSKRRFEVSDCPEIFKALSFDKVKERCLFFSQFLDVFEAKLNF